MKMTHEMKTYHIPYPSKCGQFGMIEVDAHTAEEARGKAIEEVKSIDDFDPDFARKNFQDVMNNRQATADALHEYDNRGTQDDSNTK